MADAPSVANTATGLSQVLTEIEALGTGVSANLHFWSRPDWETVFSPIEEKADTYVEALIGSTIGHSKKSQRLISSSMIEVIKGRREKLALTSNSTNQIVGICQQILAFGAAGLALSVGFSDKLHSFSVQSQKLIVLAGLFYAELVLLSLLVLIWYLLQTHFRYPFLYFKKIGNAWPYFYYASISRQVNRSPVQSAAERIRAGALYAQDFVKFSKLCLEETPRQRLRVELQQYFLLIAYQGYIQQFALRFANLFAYGFVGAALSTLLLVLWSMVK